MESFLLEDGHGLVAKALVLRFGIHWRVITSFLPLSLPWCPQKIFSKEEVCLPLFHLLLSLLLFDPSDRRLFFYDHSSLLKV